MTLPPAPPPSPRRARSLLALLAAGAWSAALVGAARPAAAAPDRPARAARPVTPAARPAAPPSPAVTAPPSPAVTAPPSPAATAPAPASVAPVGPTPTGSPSAAPTPAGPPPGAMDAAAELQAAEQAYTDLEYATARDAAARVVRQRGLTHDQLVRATRLLALTSATLDRGDEAKDAFVALIASDPEFELDPKLGPRFQDPYYEAKGYWKAQRRHPGVEASAHVRPRAPGVLRVALSDPTGLVDHVRVGFRWSPAREYARARLAAGETQVEVPAPPHGAARFDYYVQALDRRDHVLFERGNPEAPRSAVVVDAGGPPAAAARAEGGGGPLSKPLFWVAAGLALAGGAAGGYFLLRDEGGAPSAARLSPTLGCGGVRCE